MRELPYEGRKRVLRLLELFVEGQQRACDVAPYGCTDLSSEEQKEI